MAATQVPERRARYTEALLFWAITLVVCAGAGYGSYRYGRSWIGDRLGSDVKSVLTSDQLSTKVTSEALDKPGSDVQSDVAEEPPKEAVVDVKAVTVGADDKQKLDAEKAGSKSATEPDESASGDEKDDESAADSEEHGSSSSQPDRATSTQDEPKAPSSTTSRPAASSGRYVVRAGSFARRPNAESVAKELRAKGYAPYLTTVVKDNVEYTRVNVGSYDDQGDALKLRGELRGEGYSDASVATE